MENKEMKDLRVKGNLIVQYDEELESHKVLYTNREKMVGYGTWEDLTAEEKSNIEVTTVISTIKKTKEHPALVVHTTVTDTMLEKGLNEIEYFKTAIKVTRSVDIIELTPILETFLSLDLKVTEEKLIDVSKLYDSVVGAMGEVMEVYLGASAILFSKVKESTINILKQKLKGNDDLEENGIVRSFLKELEIVDLVDIIPVMDADTNTAKVEFHTTTGIWGMVLKRNNEGETVPPLFDYLELLQFNPIVSKIRSLHLMLAYVEQPIEELLKILPDPIIYIKALMGEGKEEDTEKQ